MKKLLSILTLTLVVTLGYSQNTYVGVSSGIAANPGGGWGADLRAGEISALNIGHYFNDKWGVEVNLSTSNHRMKNSAFIPGQEKVGMGIAYWSVGPSYVWARGEKMHIEVKPQIIYGMRGKMTNRRDFYLNDVNINDGVSSTWTGDTFNFKIGNSLVIGTGKLQLSIDVDYMGGNWKTFDVGDAELDMEDDLGSSSAFNRLMFSVGVRRSF